MVVLKPFPVMLARMAIASWLAWSAAAAGDGNARSLKELMRAAEDGLPAQTFRHRLAVVPFTVRGADSNMSVLVAEMAVDHFAASRTVSLIDRMYFLKVVEEHGLSESDLANPDSVVPIGRMLGAEWILTGSVTRVFGKDLVSVRILDVATTEILAAVSEAYPTEDLRKMIVVDCSASDVLYRSIWPGGGQFHCGYPVHGTLAMASFVGSAGGLAVSAFLLNERAERLRGFRRDTAVHLEAEAYREREATLSRGQNEAVDWMIWSSIALGTVWALNMADALWVAGEHRKASRNLYFSLELPSPLNRQALGLRLAVSLP